MIGHRGEDGLHLLRHTRCVRKDLRRAKLLPQQPLQRVCAIAQHNAANPTFGCCHQQHSQLAGSRGKPDGLVQTPLPKTRRAHAQIFRRLLIKTAGRGIARLVDRVGHAGSRLGEATPNLVSPQLRLVLARAYTQNPGKHALDGKRAAVHHLGQIGQGHHPIAMGGKIAAKPGHGCRLPVLAQRSTPFARTVTRSQGSGCVRKESYIGWGRAPAGAGRAAEDPGAGYGIDEISARIPRQNLLPRLRWIEIGLLNA